MTDFSKVIGEIKEKYFKLVNKNHQLATSVSMLQEELQEKNNEIQQLEMESQSLKTKVEESHTLNETVQNELNVQIKQLKEQIEQSSDATQVDVSSIVREIDDCINLVKSNL